MVKMYYILREDFSKRFISKELVYKLKRLGYKVYEIRYL